MGGIKYLRIEWRVIFRSLPSIKGVCCHLKLKKYLNCPWIAFSEEKSSTAIYLSNPMPIVLIHHPQSQTLTHNLNPFLFPSSCTTIQAPHVAITTILPFSSISINWKGLKAIRKRKDPTTIKWIPHSYLSTACSSLPTTYLMRHHTRTTWNPPLTSLHLWPRSTSSCANQVILTYFRCHRPLVVFFPVFGVYNMLGIHSMRCLTKILCHGYNDIRTEYAILLICKGAKRGIECEDKIDGEDEEKTEEAEDEASTTGDQI